MANDKSENSEEMGTAHQEHPEEASSGNETTSPETQNDTSETSAEEKLAQLEKDHLYLRAEMENIKRQNFKERSQLLKYGAERLAKDLLDTLDVFRSALSAEVNQENFKEFVSGIELTAQSLKTNLEKHGIVEVDCVGQAFDPNTQEALSSEASEDFPEGYVTKVFKPPYLYHDKLLRPGQVIVSRKKTE